MGKLLLVVDDSRTVRRTVELVFDTTEYEVVSLESGSAAQDWLKQNTPDVALVDAKMPGMDGYELGAMIKQHPESEDIPVLLMTGTDGPDEVRADEADIDGYVSKPFGSQELMNLVHMLTGGITSQMPMSFKEEMALRQREQLEALRRANSGVMRPPLSSPDLETPKPAPRSPSKVDDDVEQVALEIAEQEAKKREAKQRAKFRNQFFDEHGDDGGFNEAKTELQMGDVATFSDEATEMASEAAAQRNTPGDFGAAPPLTPSGGTPNPEKNPPVDNAQPPAEHAPEAKVSEETPSVDVALEPSDDLMRSGPTGEYDELLIDDEADVSDDGFDEPIDDLADRFDMLDEEDQAHSPKPAPPAATPATEQPLMQAPQPSEADVKIEEPEQGAQASAPADPEPVQTTETGQNTEPGQHIEPAQTTEPAAVEPISKPEVALEPAPVEVTEADRIAAAAELDAEVGLEQKPASKAPALVIALLLAIAVIAGLVLNGTIPLPM